MTFDFALRLFTAFACGVAIGLERQMRQRTAGLRTITLVASGACLFVTLGVLTGNGVAGVTQIAAYVVSGVGFLGGGVIMRDKGSIQGINTAATLWCSAAVGVLAGSGHYVPALAGTGVVLLTNTVLRGVSQAINATPVSNADLVREYQITVICLAADEVHIRTLLSNAMYAKPLSFQSLTSEDVP
ncbi:MgtC/SapB family protein, partial [Burkholderia cenocepacia]